MLVLAVGLGSTLILAMLGLEYRAGADGDIGPYQAMVMLIGALLIGIGLLGRYSWAVRLLLMGMSVLLSLAVIEAVLVTIERSIPAANVSEQSPLLGGRARPNAPGHDARGWRNLTALETAQVVAIGDSQTWGFNAAINQSWPQVLASLSDRSVYNISRGAYGSVHYELLMPEALALSPETVIIGFYLGNDLYDSYQLVYGLEAHEPRRQNRALDENTVGPRASDIIEQQWYFEDSVRRDLIGDRQPIWQMLRDNTALGRQITAVGLWPGAMSGDAFWRVRDDLRAYHSDMHPIYIGNFVTFLTPSYRLQALDLSEPRIAEGLRLTRAAFVSMIDQTAASGADLRVLFIPTKERVLADEMRQQVGELGSDYEALIAAEDAVKTELMTMLDAEGVAWADALPVLSAAAGDGVAIYPPSGDGHPTADGYRVIAASAADLLASR